MSAELRGHVKLDGFLAALQQSGERRDGQHLSGIGIRLQHEGDERSFFLNLGEGMIL